MRFMLGAGDVREKQKKNPLSVPSSSASGMFHSQNLELDPIRGKLSATYCIMQVDVLCLSLSAVVTALKLRRKLPF